MNQNNIELGNLETNKSFIKRLEPFLEGKRILEVGCGRGSLANFLYKSGVMIRAIDINSSYISEAMRRFPDMSSDNFSVMGGDVLNFPDNTFDYVFSFDVLEHIKDTDKHLQEVKRVLKPKGIYGFGTPNKITNIPWEIISSKSLTKWKTYHCSLHTYNQLKRRLRKNGFDYDFIDVPIMNDFVKNKLLNKTGIFGEILLKIIDIDKLPSPLRTNFYVLSTPDK
jgi:ubiquinone/menaquinone biosynthesis C-methylase UbiE